MAPAKKPAHYHRIQEDEQWAQDHPELYAKLRQAADAKLRLLQSYAGSVPTYKESPLKETQSKASLVGSVSLLAYPHVRYHSYRIAGYLEVSTIPE